MNRIDRRKFLVLSATAGASLFLPLRAWPYAAIPRIPEESEPHFFLQILMLGGADPSYLFDARPLALTAAGKIQNYNGVDPVLFTGGNGIACLVAESAKALLPFTDRFSVVNGVVMASTFEGHGENLNFFMTGSPFGGESFIPLLNGGPNPLPIDGVQNGPFYSSVTNHGNVVPVDPITLSLLREKLTTHAPLQEGSEAFQFVHDRFAANSAGTGSFSAGTAQMLAGLGNTSALREKLLGIAKPNPQFKTEEQFVEMLGSVFSNHVSRSALWVFAEGFDTHGEKSAKAQPEIFKKVANRLAVIFRAMANTPYDDKRSLLDVTTVVVNSEFSRTMRQDQVAFEKTGTDHNQLNNSFLVGGKGVRGGLVFGASDFASVDEVLSPAHRALDEKSLKIMGRPFDFATSRPSLSLPEVFAPERYLTSDSVVNTIYSAFGVPRTKYRALDRVGTVAPVLSGLLK